MQLAHIQKLQKAYREKQLIPFIGAGLSVPYKVPTWGELIQTIASRFIEDEYIPTITYYINKQDYWEAIKKIKSLGGIDEATLQSEISNIIKEKIRLNRSIERHLHNYSDLAGLNVSNYLTTNYDLLLFEFMRDKAAIPYILGKTNISSQYFFENKEETKILHLHGHVDDYSSIVISKEKYEELYTNEKYIDLFKLFQGSATLLFIGFSFNDYYIRDLLTRINKSYNSRHFIILDRPTNRDKEKFVNEFGINVIEYDSNYNKNHTERIREILNTIKAGDEVKKTIDEQASMDIINNNMIKSNDKMSIPEKSYYRLIGRQNVVGEIVNVLQNSPAQILSIYGMGGVGKTALVREIVEFFTQYQYFSNIVWISAKMESFSMERILRERNTAISYSELLKEICMQCGQYKIANLKSKERIIAVKEFLRQNKILIVIDNLETIKDYEEVIHYLREVLGGSKALLTTRHMLKHEDVYQKKLSGLDMELATEFIRVEAESRNVPVLLSQNASEKYEKIVKATGGIPLAMKLVIGQLNSFDFKIVIEMLKRASFREGDYEFYRYVYRNSWKLLNDNEKQLLVILAGFYPMKGHKMKVIEDVCSKIQECTLSSPDINIAIRHLVILSLVEKSGILKEESYRLHPLTHYFVKSDIIEEWKHGE